MSIAQAGAVQSVLSAQSSTTSQNIVLFQVRRNADTFNPLVTSLLKILGCPNSYLIPPSIQQRRFSVGLAELEPGVAPSLF